MNEAWVCPEHRPEMAACSGLFWFAEFSYPMGLGKGSGRGGARPGSGRKKQTTVDEQASRRSVVLDVFDEKAWRETITEWLALAKETPSVIYPLLPYILGGVKQEINVKGEIEHVSIDNARKVLRVVGGTDDRRAG